MSRLSSYINPLITFVIVFLIVNVSYSQISALDEKNGFKTIKFDTKKNDFKEIKLLGGNLYVFNGHNEDLKYAFDVKFDFLLLQFGGNDEKLDAISLKKIYADGKKPTPRNGFDEYTIERHFLKAKYIEVLGKPTYVEQDKEPWVKEINCWYGEKVGLILRSVVQDVLFNDDGTPYYNFVISVELFKLPETKASSGF